MTNEERARELWYRLRSSGSDQIAEIAAALDEAEKRNDEKWKEVDKELMAIWTMQRIKNHREIIRRLIEIINARS